MPMRAHINVTPTAEPAAVNIPSMPLPPGVDTSPNPPPAPTRSRTPLRAAAPVTPTTAPGGEGKFAPSGPGLIDQIKARASIVDWAGRYTQLKPMGGKYSGRCPMPNHEDTDPSFVVYPETESCHCFGCSASWDVISLRAAIEGTDIRSTIAAFAKEYGINTERHQEPWQKLMDLTAKRYLDAGKRSRLAREYLEKRGITEETVNKFGIGYSFGDEFSAAPAEVIQEARDCGLVKVKDDGTVRPYMSHRLTFPIRDAHGQVVGFGGRTLDWEGNDRRAGPKYLNTPETPRFHKSDLLYGLWESRSGITQAGYAVVVEGYMDVTMLHQAGMTNAVGVMGASAGDSAFKSLWATTKRVIFCLDGDAAGQKGTIRSLLVAAPTMTDGSSIGVVQMPAGVDPDEFVLKEGVEAFRTMCEKAMPLSKFLLECELEAHDLLSAEGRAAFITQADLIASRFASAPLLQAEIRLEAAALRDVAVMAVALERADWEMSEDELSTLRRAVGLVVRDRERETPILKRYAKP